MKQHEPQSLTALIATLTEIQNANTALLKALQHLNKLVDLATNPPSQPDPTTAPPTNPNPTPTQNQPPPDTILNHHFTWNPYHNHWSCAACGHQTANLPEPNSTRCNPPYEQSE